MIVKVKINNDVNRNNMVLALVVAGHNVSIEKVPVDYSYREDYYVCFDYTPKE